MPTSLMRRMFRERRRIALVVLLVFAALNLAGIGAGALPLRAAGVALGLGLALGLMSALAPGLRGFGEAIGLASLGFAGLVRAFPGSALDPTAAEASGLVTLAFGLGLVALARGARRALAVLPLPRLRNPRFKARAGSPVDIYRLWYGLVPTAGQAARYGDPDLVAIEDMSLRLGRVRLVTQAAPDPPRETLLQILEVEAPFHVRLRACAADGRGVMAATGISEIFLVDLGRSRLVLFAHEFPDLPLGRALLAWLDDRPGRMLDRRLAVIARRARLDDSAGPPPAVRPSAEATVTAWHVDAARDAGLGAGLGAGPDERAPVDRRRAS